MNTVTPAFVSGIFRSAFSQAEGARVRPVRPLLS